MMPTDEQRKRERFEEWLETEGRYRGHMLNVGHGWDAAWLARDAEVQALREALTYALHVLECLKADNPNPLLPNARWRSVDMARAALSGETGEAE